MAEDKAEEYFHGKEHYNCVQAVLKAFEGEFNVSDEQIKSAAKKGAGRAEEGLCGALYAAHELANDDEIKKELNSAFESEAGSIYCRQIRRINKLSCRQCVRLAAQKVKEILILAD